MDASQFGLGTEDLMRIAGLGGLMLKAFANCSPGLPQPWATILKKELNSERVRELRATFANTFGVTIDQGLLTPRVAATLGYY